MLKKVTQKERRPSDVVDAEVGDPLLLLVQPNRGGQVHQADRRHRPDHPFPGKA